MTDFAPNEMPNTEADEALDVETSDSIRSSQVEERFRLLRELQNEVRHEKTRCCNCTTIEQFSTDENDMFFCDKCGHDRCDTCHEYDSDNHSILSEFDEFSEYPEQYRIDDDEADESLALLEKGNLPISSILEDGFNHLNIVLEAFDNHEIAARARARAKSSSNEMKFEIAFEALKPDERTIRAVWSHSKKLWTYRCSNPPNKMPFILQAFYRVLRLRALRVLFKTAPHLGHDAYPWFRYDSDSLYLEYKRCGSRDYDEREYVDAIRSAALSLRDHVAAGLPPVAHLQITWCQNQDSCTEILDFFRHIGGIESIDLKAHDHYKGAYQNGQTNMPNELQYDPSDMQKMVNRGELHGYPFVVRLFKCDGEEIVYGVRPLQGRGDGDSDENDDDEEESENEVDSEVEEEEEESEVGDEEEELEEESEVESIAASDDEASDEEVNSEDGEDELASDIEI
ncbi:hypothetical protein VTL71DRAFT_220 [Oculimacula yallundae]|uniref:Uncharacterized protein n=1 Tax=Oculimacula yallundae TaxID=86028 RepID=A0ABR4CZI2_9HELO